MGLNLTQVLGILQLIVGTICLLTLLVLIIYGTYPQEKKILHFEIACGLVGVMDIFLGLESIVFPSKEKRGFRNAVIFNIVLTFIMAIVLIVTAHNFASTYLGDKIMGADVDLWDEIILTAFTICYALAMVAAICLVVSLVPLGMVLYKDIKKK